MWWPATDGYYIGAMVSLWVCSYFLTLAPSVNGFAELPATLVSELGCHVGIQFK